MYVGNSGPIVYLTLKSCNVFFSVWGEGPGWSVVPEQEGVLRTEFTTDVQRDKTGECHQCAGGGQQRYTGSKSYMLHDV